MGLTKKNKKPYPNLLILLEELRNHKIPMGVGTASGKNRALTMLNVLGIKHYFTAVVTAEDVHKHKPNPHIFLEVAKRLKINPENCVVIEDAKNGIEAARRGKFKVIGYTHEFSTKEDLKDADLIIKDFSELSLSKIRSLFSDNYH